MRARIIVCGLDSTGYKILCLLRQQGVPALGIHDRPIPGEDTGVVVGDQRSASVLVQAGIREAQTLVVASADEAKNLATLMQARVLNPRIRIVNRLFNTSLGDRLDQTLPDHVTMSVAALAAPVFAFAALGSQAIGQLRLFNQTWPINEEYISDRHPWRGRKLSDLWDSRSRMMIYYLPIGDQIDLVSAVLTGKKLEVGDRLLIGSKPNVRTSSHKSWLQKIVTIVTKVRYFHRYSRSVLLVALALIATIFATTIVYAGLQFNVSPIDALYFSMGMITGAGGQEEVVENSPDSIKLFTSLMMLVGAAVIGIWYALLNDFILGTRFRQLWSAASVPQAGHYIVCGLGGVGVQIATQLHSYGHEVVIIERDANNRFLNAIKSLKIPIIFGDAGLSTTLKAANVENAEALLSVTSTDSANLEVALNAKGIAPRIPVVVRYEDAHFAQMAKQIFDFKSVLSPSEIVAPAFAAAALGGRILGNGITADSLWICLATKITPEHPFCGKLAREVAMNADFVPLYIETASQTIHGWNLLDATLDPGDLLYLTIPGSHLEQIWRVTTMPDSSYATTIRAK
ncbi:TrkA-N domain protein [Thalassoporum mexicanum PCC 7367]|uniref:potassium channel family protein n=1 Tax=Thalassoporum mexicanum TaxID=3457544 RepID=UPI00029FD0B1|nr:NAD-binding protein [Pseudanabaena sp. PCC 7367]AFY69526.1 TrkA-N domain protein [Pseudanabaena sp. PCC 7367]